MFEGLSIRSEYDFKLCKEEDNHLTREFSVWRAFETVQKDTIENMTDYGRHRKQERRGNRFFSQCDPCASSAGLFAFLFSITMDSRSPRSLDSDSISLMIGVKYG